MYFSAFRFYVMFVGKIKFFLYTLFLFLALFIADSTLSYATATEPLFVLDTMFTNPLFYFILLFALSILLFLYYIWQLEKKQKIEILNLLNTDELTSLLSMRAFREKVAQTLLSANANEYEVIVFDIDYFRAINKYFGRSTGIEIIKSMADTLKRAYLQPDIYISRISAEEFVIFKKIDEGMKIEKVIELFILPSVQSIIGKTYDLNVSVGIYTISDTAEKVADLIDYADLARLNGKKIYKTTFTHFSDEMREEIEDTIEITLRMESALREKEFFVKYQPKIDFKTLKINGAEALVRWQPSVGNQIYPDRFIKVMETNGFIFELDLYVFKEVCRFISTHADSYTIPKIAVNFSAISLAEPKIIEVLLAIMQRFKVATSQIEIELTESAFVDYEEVIVERINTFRGLGFSVAVDDFGTGVSSLNRLSAMNVDVLKLDKSFLHSNQDSRGTIVVEQIIHLAKKLGMRIVSEGVENEGQVEWLRDVQCDTAQGYYFSRPIPEAEFLALLIKEK